VTAGRVRRKLVREALAAVPAAPAAEGCALCGRPLGRRVERHHAVPLSEGGRETVPVHPICHRAIHAAVANGELARMAGDMAAVRRVPEVARFVAWVAGKPPDFHAPTRRARR
jgi:hypothetical protein